MKNNEEIDKLAEEKKNQLNEDEKSKLVLSYRIWNIIILLACLFFEFVILFETEEKEIKIVISVIMVALMIFMLCRIFVSSEDALLRQIKIKYKGELSVNNEISGFELKEMNFLQDNDFETTKKIEIITECDMEVDPESYLYIDENKRKFVFSFNNKFTNIYKFNDILNFEVYEDNQNIISGNAGKVVVGSMLLGTTGALMGASAKKKTTENVQNLYLRISVNDIENPEIVIKFITDVEFEKDSDEYKKIKKSLNNICSYLEIMKNKKENKENENSLKSKLKELKEMLDEGLITEEEYASKKKKLLDN